MLPRQRHFRVVGQHPGTDVDFRKPSETENDRKHVVYWRQNRWRLFSVAAHACVAWWEISDSRPRIYDTISRKTFNVPTTSGRSTRAVQYYSPGDTNVHPRLVHSDRDLHRTGVRFCSRLSAESLWLLDNSRIPTMWTYRIISLMYD